MVFLDQYDEVYPGMGYPKMADSFQEKPYSNMQKVIDYLKGGDVIICSTRSGTDVISGEDVSRDYYMMSDGEYSWSNMLPYYVETYNLRLDEAFENKALS